MQSDRDQFYQDKSLLHPRARLTSEQQVRVYWLHCRMSEHCDAILFQFPPEAQRVNQHTSSHNDLLNHVPAHLASNFGPLGNLATPTPRGSCSGCRSRHVQALHGRCHRDHQWVPALHRSPSHLCTQPLSPCSLLVVECDCSQARWW